MFDVVALGELLIDFVCQSKNDAGYPTLAANPGGAPGNFLAALQAYGCTTAMLSKVGNRCIGKAARWHAGKPWHSHPRDCHGRRRVHHAGLRHLGQYRKS